MPTIFPSLVVEQVAIGALHPDPANPRRIGDDELESLARSLRQCGFVQPVLARREDTVVIGGHPWLTGPATLVPASAPAQGSRQAAEAGMSVPG